MTNVEMQAEAIDRARNGQSFANYPAILSGFVAKGIAADDIKPRENVFTFNAWKALGRSVKKGEHGVKVCTFITCAGADDANGEATTYRRPHTTTVFHISQTEATSERDARHAAAGYQPRGRARWQRRGTPARDPGYVDPGELAEDRWNEQYGDR